jgi:lipopolysaccharide/colanic/teichoic acid biosynthesis glycosyltransferase
VYKTAIKRVLDIILSGGAIIALGIPMLLVALAIKIDDPGPVLFKQRRVGQKKNGEIRT